MRDGPEDGLAAEGLAAEGRAALVEPLPGLELVARAALVEPLPGLGLVGRTDLDGPAAERRTGDVVREDGVTRSLASRRSSPRPVPLTGYASLPCQPEKRGKAPAPA